tara:strand:+ start:1026 stop:1619 length:594 start_codon:yes stop_codon:yes gene_type:complete
MERDTRNFNPKLYERGVLMDLNGLGVEDDFFAGGDLIKKLLVMQEVMRKKINYTKDTYENIYAYGYNFFTAGQFDKAKDIFKILMILDPQNVKAFIALGGCFQKLENFETAMNIYRAGIFIDPENSVLSMNIGLCHMNLEELPAAEQSFLAACLISHKNRESDPKTQYFVAEKLWKMTRSKQKKQAISIEQSLIQVD